MLEKEISTEGLNHIYCSVPFNTLDSHGKGPAIPLSLS